MDLTSGTHCGREDLLPFEALLELFVPGSKSVHLKCVVGRAFGEAVEHCVVAEESERPIVTQVALSLTATTVEHIIINLELLL